MRATARPGEKDFPDRRESRPSQGNRKLATTAITPLEQDAGKHLFLVVMNMLF